MDRCGRCDLIDAHCHIDLYPEPEKQLAYSQRQGHTIIAVTNLPSHWKLGEPYFRGPKRIRQAVGLHPLLAQEHTIQERNLFQSIAQRCSYVGEVGLDYSPEGRESFQRQLESFEFVLQTIENQPKFLSIHSRSADGETLRLLTQFRRRQAVFHWYTGSLSMAEKILEQNHFFSINPAMIRGRKGQELLKILPRTSVLTETDGPHINHAGMTIKPGEVNSVYEYLSDLWDLSESEVFSQIQQNLTTILSSLKQSF